MRIITCGCSCRDWENVGPPVDSIPDCEFAGIHWLTNRKKAILLWKKLKAYYKVLPGHVFSIPYYWAVHINREHIINIKEN